MMSQLQIGDRVQTGIFNLRIPFIVYFTEDFLSHKNLLTTNVPSKIDSCEWLLLLTFFMSALSVFFSLKLDFVAVFVLTSKYILKFII